MQKYEKKTGWIRFYQAVETFALFPVLKWRGIFTQMLAEDVEPTVRLGTELRSLSHIVRG